MPSPARVVVGVVCRTHYEVRVLAKNEEVIEDYLAGNNPGSSAFEDSLPEGHPRAEPRGVLFMYCNDTAKEMAEEHGGVPVDVRYEEDW